MKYIKLFENYKNSGFIEYTFTDGEGNEVMVDIQTDGTIIGIYTYKDCPMSGFDWESGRDYEMNKGWKPKKNELFVHCPNSQKRYLTTMKRLAMNNFVLSLDDSNENYDRDIEVFIKMLNKYDIKGDNFIE